MKSVSVQGIGEINEDIFGGKGKRFWVFDGATPVSGNRYYSDVSDAHYIVNLFNEMMIELDTGKDSNIDLLIRCKDEILSKVINIKNVPDDEQPSFALAIVNIEEDEIELTVLSDCYVLLIGSEKVKVITDTRINVVAERSKRLLNEIETQEVTEEVARKQLKDQYKKNRKLMNKEGGYFVGTFDGKGFSQALNISVSKREVEKVLICTDGFFKAFELNLVSFEGLLRNEATLDDIIIRLRKYEKNITKTLTKKMDDATAIMINI